MFSSLGELMRFCLSAETSLVDNRAVDSYLWDFAFDQVDVSSFTIFIIWIVKTKIMQCIKSGEDEELSVRRRCVQICMKIEMHWMHTTWTARWLMSLLLFLFSLIFPSQLTQFNSCKTRVQLGENLCPLCAPISTVHIWVQIRAWIMQLPPTWTLLIPVCLTAVGIAEHHVNS